jgi:hypothetical protein
MSRICCCCCRHATAAIRAAASEAPGSFTVPGGGPPAPPAIPLHSTHTGTHRYTCSSGYRQRHNCTEAVLLHSSEAPGSLNVPGKGRQHHQPCRCKGNTHTHMQVVQVEARSVLTHPTSALMCFYTAMPLI